MKTIEERFWEKVNRTGGCWLWTASTRDKGYGAFTYQKDGRVVQDRAHRFSWTLHRGPIPPGLWVLHNCPGGDNPACVNPEHLWLGTSGDNIRDMNAKGRHVAGGTYTSYEDGAWKRGSGHHAAKLNEDDVREMRRLHASGGWSYGQLGQRFGVNGTAAFKIVKRMLWRHVDDGRGDQGKGAD